MIKVYASFLFFSLCAGEVIKEYKVDLLHPLFKKQEDINYFITEPVVINEVEFVIPGTMSADEARILTHWQPPCELDAKQCYKGIVALVKKKLFKSLTLTLKKIDQDTILQCVCDPLEVITKINHQQIRLQKEYIFSYYDVQVGDAFSEEKHKEALKKVKHACERLGYIGAKITDTIGHDKEKHEVTIDLECDHGKKFIIKSITFVMQSPDNKQYELLREELHHKYETQMINQTYQEKVVQSYMQTIENYLKKDGYIEPLCTYDYHPNYEHNTVALTVTIKLGKKRLFTFVGNNFYSSYELSHLLTQSGSAVWLLPPSLLTQDVILLYRKKGFWNVDVKVERSGLETFFIIKEGSRIKVQDIQCKGLPELSSKDRVQKFFRGIIKQKYFDEDTLQQAVDKVLNYYRQVGYWDIALTKKNYDAHEDNFYTVVLLFSSGEQRTVHKVVIKDFEELEKRGPFGIINRDTNLTPITKASLQEQQTWLLDYFRKKGFSGVQVSSTFDTQENESVLVWTIENLIPLYYGKTIVQGKCPISYKKLLTFMDYKEGQEWKKESLMRTYSNLRSLDIFKYIALYPEAYDSEKLTRDVILHLQEDDPYEIRVRLGFQQVSKNFAFKKGSTYKAGTTFIAKNITHNADTLRLDADFTRFARKVDFSYQFPHPFLLPITILTKAYANKYTQPVAIGSRKTLYEATQEGFLTSISGRYSSVSYGSNVGFEWMKTKDISNELAQAINFKTDLINKKILYFFVEPTIFVDLLDDKINPTRGIFGLASLKSMIPVHQEDAAFVKLMVEQGLFFPLTKYSDIICATRIRFGHIFNDAFSKIMPPERFYLGGANSLRGYLPDACPPLGSYIDDEDGKKRYVPQGGKTMLNMNFELRIPFTKAFYGAVFQDFGVLVEDLTALQDSSNAVTSTGFGIRYLTPIGPLRFDIGFKWKKTYEDEPGYAWFLTLGHAF